MGLFDWLKKGGKEVYNLSYHIMGEAVGKKLAEVGATKTTERIFEDKRGELMADILAIAPNNQNLLRRHQEASSRYRENRLVTLLTKIPRVETEEIEVETKGKKERKIIRKEVRKELLKKLERVSEEEFSQYLEMLEHDIVKQSLMRWMVPAITLATVATETAAEGLKNLSDKIKARYERR